MIRPVYDPARSACPSGRGAAQVARRGRFSRAVSPSAPGAPGARAFVLWLKFIDRHIAWAPLLPHFRRAGEIRRQTSMRSDPPSSILHPPCSHALPLFHLFQHKEISPLRLTSSPSVEMTRPVGMLSSAPPLSPSLMKIWLWLQNISQLRCFLQPFVKRTKRQRRERSEDHFFNGRRGQGVQA